MRLFWLIVLLFLTSCAFLKSSPNPNPPFKVSKIETTSPKKKIESPKEEPRFEETRKSKTVFLSHKPHKKVRPEETNEHRLSPPAVRSPEVLTYPSMELKLTSPERKKKHISLDLEGADLLDFLDLVMRETLGLNYVVDPLARAKITAHIQGDFLPTEILEIVRAILELHNLELVSVKGLWKVIPVQKIGQIGEKSSFLAVRPRYVSVRTLIPVVRSFLSPQAKVLTEPNTNMLVVVGRPDNLKTAFEVIKLIDREGFSQFTYRIYPSRVLSAEVLVRYVQQALRSQALKASGLAQRVELVPLKELDNVLVLARNEEDLQEVWKLLKTLDQGNLKEEQIFIYQVENGDAEEIAKLLEDIFSTTKVSGRRTVIKARRNKNSQATAALEGQIKIVPDKTNNMLLIRASKEDYRKILNILKKIDVVPRQVVIEVLIAEITLNKALEYGLEWYLKTSFKLEGKPITGQMVFARKDKTPLNLPSEVTGFTYSLFRGQSLRSLLYALSSISRINILSSPVILATDNKEARIQIGQEVPIITQRVTNTSATVPTVTSNVQYKDAGIILQVKPHINSSGLVKLDIIQEVSTAQKNYLGLTDTPLFTKRRIETSLVVEDNQTVILGGLIDTRHEIGKTGIPLLRNLPLLGRFFEWSTSSRDRTELFVAITPRVVRSREEADRVMKDFKRRIEELRKRLEVEMQ